MVDYTIFTHYGVTCRTDKFRGKWVVRRLRDGEVMTEDYYPYSCLKWVQVWGPIRLHGK